MRKLEVLEIPKRTYKYWVSSPLHTQTITNVNTYLYAYLLKHRWLLTLKRTIHAFFIINHSSYICIELWRERIQGRRQLLLEGRRLKPNLFWPKSFDPSSLMAIGTFFLDFFFSLKIAKNGFWQLFSPHNFWTKIALFFGKYCNNQVKIPTDKL